MSRTWRATRTQRQTCDGGCDIWALEAAGSSYRQLCRVSRSSDIRNSKWQSGSQWQCRPGAPNNRIVVLRCPLPKSRKTICGILGGLVQRLAGKMRDRGHAHTHDQHGGSQAPTAFVYAHTCNGTRSSNRRYVEHPMSVPTGVARQWQDLA